MEWVERVVEEGRVVALELRGEIDLQHSPTLRQLLQEKAGCKLPALILDFSQVSYIDSSGLATLVEYYQQTRSFDGQVAVAAATERVRSIFDLVRLNEIFRFYPSVPEAVRGLDGVA